MLPKEKTVSLNFYPNTQCICACLPMQEEYMCEWFMEGNKLLNVLETEVMNHRISHTTKQCVLNFLHNEKICPG